MIWVLCFAVLLAVWVVCGITHGGMIGLERKNNASGGVGLAMWAGPFSALFIDRVRDRHRYCPWCDGTIPAAAEICPHCQEWVNGRPRVVEIGRDVRIIETRRVEREESDA